MRLQRSIRLFTLLLLLASVAVTTARAQSTPLSGLDDYVAKAMAEWDVPGLAIAIVKDDTSR